MTYVMLTSTLQEAGEKDATRDAKVGVLRRVPRGPPEQNELHLRRLVGVDVSVKALENAAKVVGPAEEEANRVADGGWVREESERWEELRIELYEGGLELHNPGLDGIDGMIATEVSRGSHSTSSPLNIRALIPGQILQVIEHMTATAFDKFPRVILGGYRPKVLVITTPNHEFNPWFVSSSKDEESRNRFPDPTGRTNRIFRDDDHEFEMTTAEFQDWANAIADEHAYDVAFSGVGLLGAYYGGSQDIPARPPSLGAHPAMADHPSSLAVPPDPYAFHATQIATFVRRDSGEPERSPRSHHTSPLPFYSSLAPPPDAPSTTASPSNGAPARPPPNPRKSVPNRPHALAHSFVHAPHPRANQPAPAREILECLAGVLGSADGPAVEAAEGEGAGGEVGLGDLWRSGEVRRCCGGVKGALVDAVVEEGGGEWGLRVDVDEGRVGEAALMVIWKGWVGPPVAEWKGGSSGEDSGEERGGYGANGVGGTGVNGGGWGADVQGAKTGWGEERPAGGWGVLDGVRAGEEMSGGKPAQAGWDGW